MSKPLISVKKKVSSKGFSLLEATIALVVIGVISMATIKVYDSASYYKNQAWAGSWLVESPEALVQFAQMNYRLACPDIDLDGFEDCGSSSTAGSVPFYTLGMQVSSQIADAAVGHQNLIYGVYRDDVHDADLTELKERTGDSLGDAGFESLEDFKKALSNASLQSITINQPYISGDDITTGAEDCSVNPPVANGAFWLASSGGQDGNGDGNPFDGVNTYLKHDGTGTLCFSAPTKQQNTVYNDRVSGLAFSELLGLL
jgi:prepilin-type N-terminal cleavage/methylation domain-containing protein